MNKADFLAWCKGKPVSFSLEGPEQLKVNAVPGSLNSQDIEFIKNNKQAIIDCLAQLRREKISKRPDLLDTIPLTYAQQRIWLLQQIDSDSSGYNEASTIRLKGNLNREIFERAFKRIVERHEMLRSTIHVDELGTPYQKVLKGVELEVKWHECQAQDEDSSIQLFLTSCGQARFDLAGDIPIRVNVLRIDDFDHVVQITVHHVASDGWSMGVLVDEFSALYAYFGGDIDSQPEPLHIQYGDYAYWQRQWFNETQVEKDLAYWQTQLEGVQPTHSLPLDNPRPKLQSFNGDAYVQLIDSNLLTRLKQLCMTQSASLFTGLYSVFAVLLAKLSNESDIVIGTPIANRDLPDTHNLIGLFLDTLVLRSNIDNEVSFEKILSNSKQVLAQAQKHQGASFERIVERIDPQRSSSHSPLYQVMIVLQNAVQGSLSLPEIELQDVKAPVHTAKFDLTLHAKESEHGLSLVWEYNTDLFKAQTIEKWSQQLNNLLLAIVENPLKPLGELSLLSEGERHKILTELSHTRITELPAVTLHQAFESRVAEMPNVAALSYGNQTLSYRLLNRHANKLAQELLQSDLVQPGDRVGICFKRSLDMIVAILATLKVGAVYVPLDPKYPNARLDYICRDSEMALVLTHDAAINGELNLSCFVHHVVIKDACIRLDKYDHNVRANERRGNSADGAYIIYTSGSTGQPKGVCINHGNAIALINWAQGYYSAEQLSRVLASTSLNFDLSIFEIFVPLCLGHECVVVDSILDLIETPKLVSLINTVPSALQAVLEHNVLPDTLRVINVAGEPLSKDLVNQAFTQAPSIWLCNLYGPTEDTTYSTAAKFTGPLEEAPSIGKVIDNSIALILDENLKLVPCGHVGELFLGGRGVTNGYYGQVQLTQEKFIANPYQADMPLPAEVLYRTGDMVKMRPDGNIDFIGRTDEYVKLRGFRIGLNEVKYHIEQLSMVDSAVVSIEEVMAEKHLVAYIKRCDQIDKKVTLDMLGDELAKELPHYMVPSAFLEVEQWSLLPNGKLNKHALPRVELPTSKTKLVVSNNAHERALIGIFSELLGHPEETISVQDTFFKLGGHSLQATRLKALIEKEFSVTIDLRQLFDEASIMDIASALIQKQAAAQLANADAEEIEELEF